MQRQFKHPIFVYLRKHNCPQCSNLLEKVTYSRTVNINSSEGRFFDFSETDTSVRGDVLFVWDEFRCSKCGKHFSVDSLFLLEKEKKKRRKQEKRALRKQKN
jgi:hypothetical protein